MSSLDVRPPVTQDNVKLEIAARRRALVESPRFLDNRLVDGLSSGRDVNCVDKSKRDVKYPVNVFPFIFDGLPHGKNRKVGSHRHQK